MSYPWSVQEATTDQGVEILRKPGTASKNSVDRIPEAYTVPLLRSV